MMEFDEWWGERRGGDYVEVVVVMDRRRNLGGVIGIIKEGRGYRCQMSKSLLPC
jgi:hypothetical protein